MSDLLLNRGRSVFRCTTRSAESSHFGRGRDIPERGRTPSTRELRSFPEAGVQRAPCQAGAAAPTPRTPHHTPPAVPVKVGPGLAAAPHPERKRLKLLRNRAKPAANRPRR
eukprot:10287259-Alexandrium_andersonii.AAC.1